MVLFVPRVAFYPNRCHAPAYHRQSVAPLFSLLDDTFNELAKASRQAYRSQQVINPRFDVHETKEGYQVEGELPGVSSKDIDIEFSDDQTLIIKGKAERSYVTGANQQSPLAESPESQQIQQHQTSQEAVVPSDTASETSSVKSYQATVEDDYEDLANDSETQSLKNGSTSKGKQIEKPARESDPVPSAQAASQPGQEHPTQQERSWVSERSFGSFSRTFRFPVRIDREEVRASLNNGVLSIAVPKAPVPEKTRILIQ